VLNAILGVDLCENPLFLDFIDSAKPDLRGKICVKTQKRCGADCFRFQINDVTSWPEHPPFARPIKTDSDSRGGGGKARLIILMLGGAKAAALVATGQRFIDYVNFLSIQIYEIY
jgi:hypothetical protein